MLLYLRELYMAKKSFIIWTLCLAGLMFLSMGLFPSFSSQAFDLTKYLSAFPEDMLKGFSMIGLNFNVAMDYFTYMFPYAMLAAAIWATLMGANMLGKEEGERTIEFLYAKPVTRSYIFAAKLCAILTQLALFLVLFWAGSLLGFVAFADSTFNAGVLFLQTLGMVLTMLVFASIGFLLSVFIVKARKVMPVALGMGLGLYVLSIIANIKDEWTWMRYVVPYQYFEGIKVLRAESLDAGYVALALGISLICLAAAWLVYRRKDILT